MNKNVFIDRNYKICIDVIFEEEEPDGYTITGEIFTFFEKLNSIHEVEDEENLELFTKLLNSSIQSGGELSIKDDFIQSQWIEIIDKFMPKHKKDAILELVFFGTQELNYWSKLGTLEFSLAQLNKEEKIITSQIKDLSKKILHEWSERDNNWQKYAQAYLDLLASKAIESKDINISDIKKALKEFKLNNPK